MSEKQPKFYNQIFSFWAPNFPTNAKELKETLIGVDSTDSIKRTLVSGATATSPLLLGVETVIRSPLLSDFVLVTGSVFFAQLAMMIGRGTAEALRDLDKEAVR